MATYGKYQVYYEKIKTEVEKIREENGYLNLSKAPFASGTAALLDERFVMLMSSFIVVWFCVTFCYSHSI